MAHLISDGRGGLMVDPNVAGIRSERSSKDRDYTKLLGHAFDIEVVVDLIKRSDKADAIELLHGIIACARSGGATEGSDEAWAKAFTAFDRAAASLSTGNKTP